jgi:hypothetical protein
MKSVEEVTACVCDYGTFLTVAEKLAETMARVYYHSPITQEYLDVRDCVIGGGLEHVKRLDEPLDPDILDSIDLFVFPDIGFTGMQRHLRAMGKAVWGHMGATDLELHRTGFVQMLEQTGLPMVHNERIVGLSALADYLKEHENVWVKINRFRKNMETWHHQTYKESIRALDSLAVIFGGAKEEVVFVVQDDIESDLEIGYDGWCIDGQFPSRCFQGYEKKNELYLGSVLNYDKLPEGIRVVNEALAPLLADYRYRNWLATEIREKDGTPYFIDITPRMAGQTGEQQLETWANFADSIWQGAHGIMLDPIFEWNFAAEATLHYKSDTKDPTIVDEWKTLEIPAEASRWVKLYHYCRDAQGVYQFPARNTDEVGVVLGVGDSIEESIEHLGENLELLKDLPVHANVGGFASLLDSIKEAEKQGIAFGGRIPKPEAIFKKKGLRAA